jgi:hypothetical protein
LRLLLKNVHHHKKISRPIGENSAKIRRKFDENSAKIRQKFGKNSANLVTLAQRTENQFFDIAATRLPDQRNEYGCKTGMNFLLHGTPSGRPDSGESESRSQSYDRELQRQRCKSLQRC